MPVRAQAWFARSWRRCLGCRRARSAASRSRSPARPTPALSSLPVGGCLLRRSPGSCLLRRSPLLCSSSNKQPDHAVSYHPHALQLRLSEHVIPSHGSSCLTASMLSADASSMQALCHLPSSRPGILPETSTFWCLEGFCSSARSTARKVLESSNSGSQCYKARQRLFLLPHMRAQA